MTELTEYNNIDWDTVQTVLDESMGGEVFEPFISEKYPEKERQIALLALQEKQLLLISDALRFVAYSAGVDNEAEIKKYLTQAYCDLEMTSKYELLPLFFSPDMLTNKSIYIDDASIRDAAFKAYNSLIQDDSLSLRDLKRCYLESQDFAHLLPIHINLPQSQVIGSGKSAQLNVEPPKRQKQVRKQNPKEELSNQIIGEIKVIVSPKRAYFNRSTTVEYRYGLGDLIEPDNVFVTLADDSENIKIKASKPSVISKIYINNGEHIGSAGLNICEITELKPYDYRRLLSESKRLKHSNETKQSKVTISKTIETNQDVSGDVEKRLRDLKNLYAKKLITKPVYENKMYEILTDL